MQYGVSLQHEILPRVSVDVGYNRRAWSNFFFTDNRAIGPQDFDKVSITAPSNSNLPGGGGFPVSFLTRNARTGLGATDNYYTFASDYGDVTAYWHGVDVNVNARMSNGLVVQGGTSTGRGVRDFCDILDDLPELYVTGGSGFTNWQQGSCAVTEPFCETCNRMRLSATGRLHSCLGRDDEVDLRPHLRDGSSDEAILALVRGGASNKAEGHAFTTSGGGGPMKHMVAIGG